MPRAPVIVKIKDLEAYVTVVYRPPDSEIEEFEDLDKHLLRKILQVSISTPEEAMYLELGILPIGVMIKARRINYFHYLLTRDESEMLSQFFYTQWKMPCKGDWTESVRVNLEEFGIPCELEILKCKCLCTWSTFGPILN